MFRIFDVSFGVISQIMTQNNSCVICAKQQFKCQSPIAKSNCKTEDPLLSVYISDKYPPRLLANDLRPKLPKSSDPLTVLPNSVVYFHPRPFLQKKRIINLISTIPPPAPCQSPGPRYHPLAFNWPVELYKYFSLSQFASLRLGREGSAV